MDVLGISGSLRSKSTNTGLLRAAQQVAPAGMSIEIYGLDDVPLYNYDLEAAGDAEPVIRLKRAIDRADAVLIATPEYNRSIPGVLKNAIDWASRPPRYSVLDRKPVALMGATTGMGGTANAQAHLRLALAFPGAQTMEEPELLVTHSREKFDEDGNLVDELTRADLRVLLEALAEWTSRVQELVAAA